MKNIGLVVGRFNPLHNGHLRLIDYAKNECNKLHIAICGPIHFIDSNNPFTGLEVKELLTQLNGNIKFHLVEDVSDDKKWFDRILSCLEEIPDVIYVGCQTDKCRIYNCCTNIEIKVVQRKEVSNGGISGTLIRRLMDENRKIEQYVPVNSKRLLIQTYKKRKMILNDISPYHINKCSFQQIYGILESICSDGFKSIWSVNVKGNDYIGQVLFNTNYPKLFTLCKTVLLPHFSFSRTSKEFNYKFLVYITKYIPKITNYLGDQKEIIKIHCQENATRVQTKEDLHIIIPHYSKRVYLLNKSQNTVILMADPNEYKDGMRILRGLVFDGLRNEWEKLHAALIGIGKNGVLITGPKGAGKTTLTLKLLKKYSDLCFSSDDKVYYNKHTKIAVGSPQALRIKSFLHCELRMEGQEDDYVPKSEKYHIFPAILFHRSLDKIRPWFYIKSIFLIDSDSKYEKLEIIKLNGNKDDELETYLSNFNDSLPPYWLISDFSKSSYSLIKSEIPKYRIVFNQNNTKHLTEIKNLIFLICK